MVPMAIHAYCYCLPCQVGFFSALPIHHCLCVTEFISPSVMIPENRLANLFDQVKRKWVSDCLYHNVRESPSLFYDHTCDRSNIPCHKLETLQDHDNEVWYLAFSNNGKYLATASADRTVIIYDVANAFAKLHTLSNHKAGVCFLAWSPDDQRIITCTREQDSTVRVYDAMVSFGASQNRDAKSNISSVDTANMNSMTLKLPPQPPLGRQTTKS
jgi:WD40 repeat protein